MIDKGTNPQLRKEYKAVLLVSINHKKPKTMWGAISLHFREDLEYMAGDERLTKDYIMGIYDRLLEHNKPIAKFMNTGVAMRLMRKDSEISDRILNQFAINEIPIRCVHDSFIVPAEYEKELKTLMVYYFQEVIDTDYEIGITTETTVADTKEDALNASVLNAEKIKAPEAKVEIVDTEDDSGDDFDNNKLNDNMKYFQEILVEDDLMEEDDCDIDWSEITRTHGKHYGNRFEGIRF
jgi:hypothetical protein